MTELLTDEGVPELIGTSTVVDRLRRDVEQAARSHARVLITGESGTGKEVVTRLIHARSTRVLRPLIPINCAGLAETLLESELFGHQRGSFTGATADKAGLLERAHLGTVFLDEVGEMSPRMQGLLLRFLETGEIHRVGTDRAAARVDVRVVAATNRDLAARVTTGEFRLDLFYRLNVLHLRTPSLRDRPKDIPELLACFLRRYALAYRAPVPLVTPDALESLLRYAWPGNVRQLKNVAERLIVRAPDTITAADLPPHIAGAPAPSVAPPPAPLADRLLARIEAGGESFWSAVYAPFMSRDLTRDDVRALVRKGLARTRGRYSGLVQLLNMPADDEKRFVNFLRKHQCQIEAQGLEPAPAERDRSLVAG